MGQWELSLKYRIIKPQYTNLNKSENQKKLKWEQNLDGVIAYKKGEAKYKSSAGQKHSRNN